MTLGARPAGGAFLNQTGLAMLPLAWRWGRHYDIQRALWPAAVLMADAWEPEPRGQRLEIGPPL